MIKINSISIGIYISKPSTQGQIFDFGGGHKSII